MLQPCHRPRLVQVIEQQAPVVRHFGKMTQIQDGGGPTIPAAVPRPCRAKTKNPTRGMFARRDAIQESYSTQHPSVAVQDKHEELGLCGTSERKPQHHKHAPASVMV